MNRRQFLTMSGAVVTIGLAHMASPGSAAAKGISPATRGKLYQGTKDGKLFESADGGKTWQQIANFGEHCAVQKIDVRRNGSVTVKLACAYNTFDLNSQDARLWRTA